MPYIKKNWTRALVNHSTNTTALAAPVPGTIPTQVDDAGTPTSNMPVIPLSGKRLQILPVGTGVDNSTFNLQITLWSKAPVTDTLGAAAANDLWLPYYVGGFLCTIDDALNGVANAVLVTTDKFADTITEIATATWDDADTSAKVRVSVRSHANSHLAMIEITGIQDFDLATIDFDIATGVTGQNALYRCLED